MKDERTLRHLAEEALVIQDACNLSGVVHAWSRSVSRLRELFPEQDTEGINRHPVCVLFADKLSSLASSDMVAFGEAYKWAKKLVGEKK